MISSSRAAPVEAEPQFAARAVIVERIDEDWLLRRVQDVLDGDAVLQC